jgi:hypothetical protein
MKWSRHQINEAWALSFREKMHGETCPCMSTKANLDVLAASGVYSTQQMKCECGAIDRALKKLYMTAPTEKVGCRAAHRRLRQQARQRAKNEPASDEARLFRATKVALGENDKPLSDHDFDTAVRWIASNRESDDRDYTLMAWHQQMQAKGWPPAQRVRVHAHMQALIHQHSG